jgi:two-component system, OmpR family, response regulator TctD
MIAMRVLLVADRGDVGESTVARLKEIGYAVDWAIKGTDADNLLSYETYDLIILDLTLQDIDGLYLLKQLRQRGSSTPALVLTARSATHERIKALDLGADDYLIKPFDYRELEARARALLRRANSGISTKKWSCGNMVVDRNTRSLLVKGVMTELTRREFALTETLARHPGRVFSKDEIIEQLFGFDDESPTENAVEQIVARLRRKLATSESSAEIRTLRGLGYKMVNQSDRCSLAAR